MSKPTRVAVETPARLHFGVLDLGGRLGRCFGGLGAAIPFPSLRIEAAVSDRLTGAAEGGGGARPAPGRGPGGGGRDRFPPPVFGLSSDPGWCAPRCAGGDS